MTRRDTPALALAALATPPCKSGQDPAEAVFAGKPVLFGPRMENFTPLVDLLLRHPSAMQVRDFEDLEKQLESLLQSPR